MITSKNLSDLKRTLQSKGSLHLVNPATGEKVNFKNKEELLETLIDLGKKGYLSVEENGEIYEHAKSFRTLEDLYRICYHYYPRMTLKTLIVYLWSTCSWKVICKQINKRTYRGFSSRYGLDTMPSQSELIKRDEYGWTFEDYHQFVQKQK